MLKKYLNTLSGAVLLGLLLLTSTAHTAGFHYQLNLTAKLAALPDGKVNGVEMSWVYDPVLSATLMDGEDLSEANRAETLKRRAADILDGLLEMNYFTTIYLNKALVTTEKVEKYNLQLTDSGQLQLNLTLPFSEAKTLNGRLLEVVVSDPTAIGLATFLSADRFILDSALEPICRQPTLEQKQLGEMDGHVLLSETMTIDCR
ncbi:DUF1007 family protein [Leucothrix sargassi]|nr:DUF1007 family protein [Leucothrix sargassi]